MQVTHARYRWVNATRGGAVLSECAEEAEAPFSGSGESTGQPPLEPGTGLHLERCNTLDTSRIRSPIDVIFLDANLQVVKAIQCVGRWDQIPVFQSACSALELPAGMVARTQTQVGDLLQQDPSDAPRPAVPAEARQQPRISLEPLRCAQCGGPVPLTDAVSTRCPYCGAQVPIPAEYHALRAAAWRSAEDHRWATAAYDELGRPPGALLRAWAGMAMGVVGALWWFFTVFLDLWSSAMTAVIDALRGARDQSQLLIIALAPAALLLLLFGWVFTLLGDGLHAAAIPLHVDLLAVHAPAAVYAVLGLIAYLVFPVPLALYGFGQAFAKVRQELQSSLAARPPQTPGGPALCRNCAAPLNIPPGALGTRCDYCRADNLVALPADWVDAVESSERMEHLEIWQAIEEEKQVRKSASAKMWRVLRAALWVIPFFAFGGYLVCLAGWVRR